MPNRFTPIQPGTPEDQKLSIINKNFAELDNESVKKLYYGSDGVPRIFINGSDGTIKVAPEGTDVTSAEENDLVFNSERKMFQIVSELELSATVSHTNGGGGSFVQTEELHGLPYTPQYQAALVVPQSLQTFTGVGLNNHPNPALMYGTSGGFVVLFYVAEVSVNSTSVALSVQIASLMPTGTYTTTATVYLLQESY